MDIVSTYSVKIKEYNQIFKESIEQYRSAVKFFVDVCLREWNEAHSNSITCTLATLISLNGELDSAELSIAI